MNINKFSRIFFPLLIAATIFYSCKNSGNGASSDSNEKVSGHEIADLALAPMVPLPITRNHPTKVVVN